MAAAGVVLALALLAAPDPELERVYRDAITWEGRARQAHEDHQLCLRQLAATSSASALAEPIADPAPPHSAGIALHWAVALAAAGVLVGLAVGAWAASSPAVTVVQP